jgi:energy-coupling factor transporter transmembrane protein EcfT
MLPLSETALMSGIFLRFIMSVHPVKSNEYQKITTQQQWNGIGTGKPRKSCPSATLSSTIILTLASVVHRQKTTARAMLRPKHLPTAHVAFPQVRSTIKY